MRSAVQAFWPLQNLAAGGIHFRRGSQIQRGPSPYPVLMYPLDQPGGEVPTQKNFPRRCKPGFEARRAELELRL